MSRGAEDGADRGKTSTFAEVGPEEASGVQRSDARRTALGAEIELQQREIRKLRGQVGRLERLLRMQADDSAASRHLEELVLESERRAHIDEALRRATLAFQRSPNDPDAVVQVAGQALLEGDLRSVLCDVDPERGEVVFRQYFVSPVLLRATEQLTGIPAEGFRLRTRDIELFRRVVEDRETVFTDDMVGFVERMLPEQVRWTASLLANIIGGRDVTMAPLVVGGRVAHVFMIFSEQLRPQDRQAVAFFAQLLAAAHERARMVRELQEHVGRLEDTQAQLVQAQKMEAVGQLVGGIAHDFNNMLTAIGSAAHLAQIEADEPNRLESNLELVADGVQKAGTLARQLLHLSRPSMRVLEKVDVDELLHDLEPLLTRVLDSAHFQIDLEAASGATIEVERSQLEQVVLNFVVNARDAMPEGGRIRVAAVRAADGQLAGVEVADTGQGMDPETRARALDPFFTTKGRRGTGLGLSVVRSIVEARAGRLEIETTPARGTGIRALFPLA
ncbi:MAG: ATP-binding protein [Sandaracinaceae bacterium]